MKHEATFILTSMGYLDPVRIFIAKLTLSCEPMYTKHKASNNLLDGLDCMSCGVSVPSSRYNNGCSVGRQLLVTQRCECCMAKLALTENSWLFCTADDEATRPRTTLPASTTPLFSLSLEAAEKIGQGWISKLSYWDYEGASRSTGISRMVH